MKAIDRRTFLAAAGGLAAGAEYVAEGGFVLKSELGKGSAEHSH